MKRSRLGIIIFVSTHLIAVLSLISSAPAKPFLYWSSFNEVNRAPLDGGPVEVILTDPGIVFGGVALDEPNQQLYTSDAGTCCGTAPSGSGLSVGNLDGSAKQLIVGNTEPTDVEIDLVSEKIYWSDAGSSNRAIRRANLDGTNVNTILSFGNFDLVEGLAIDPDSERVFYTLSDEIRVVDFDGGNDGVFLSLPSGSSPFDVEIDLNAGMLYWNETSAERIARTQLNAGGPVEDIISPGSGMTVNNGMYFDVPTQKVYFSTDDGELMRVNSDGTGLTTLLADPAGANYIGGVVNVIPEPNSLHLSIFCCVLLMCFACNRGVSFFGK